MDFFKLHIGNANLNVFLMHYEMCVIGHVHGDSEFLFMGFVHENIRVLGHGVSPWSLQALLYMINSTTDSWNFFKQVYDLGFKHYI